MAAKRPKIPVVLKARSDQAWRDAVGALDDPALRCAVALIVWRDFQCDSILRWVDDYYLQGATYVPDAEVQNAMVRVGYTEAMAAHKFAKVTVPSGPPKKKRSAGWTLGDKIERRAKHWNKQERKVHCA